MYRRWEDIWWINFLCLIACYLTTYGLNCVKMYERERSQQLPGMQFSPPLRFLSVVIYEFESYMEEYFLPFASISILFTSILYLKMRYRLGWHLNISLGSPVSFPAGVEEEQIGSLVNELKFYRQHCFQKGEFYHDTRLLLPREIYYKKVDVKDLTRLESEFWPTFNHPNLSPLYIIPDLKHESFFATDVFEWRTLLTDVIYNEDFNNRRDFFKFAIKWSHDVLMGLQYLHRKSLYHLNLDPENIMIDFRKAFMPQVSNAVIGNFTHMDHVTNGMKLVHSEKVGFTENYRPAEAFVFKTVNAEKIDMWGLGIITLEIFTGGFLRLWQRQYTNFSNKCRDHEMSKMLVYTNFTACVEASHKCFRYYKNSPSWKQKSICDQIQLKLITDDCFILNETQFWQIWVFIADLLRLDSHIRLGLDQSVNHGFVKNVYQVIFNPLIPGKKDLKTFIKTIISDDYDESEESMGTDYPDDMRETK